MPTLDFKEILDGLPEKPPRSRLEPYRELILEMRRRGRPLREVAQVLGEKCGVHVVPSTVYDFVRAAQSAEQKRESHVENPRRRPTVRQENLSRATSHEEVDRRIAALKARKVPTPTVPGQFRFVSGEPLRLPSRAGRNRQVQGMAGDEE